jgi:hypothetical protein
MPITIGGVVCECVSTGYGEKADSRGPEATKGFLCNWADRFKVANALMGVVGFSGTGNTGAITLPNRTGLLELPALFVQSVRIEGKGRPSNNYYGLGFDKAIVWADYGVPEYSSGGAEAQFDPETSFLYATQELDSSEEYVEIPGQALIYPDGTPSNVNKTIKVVTVDMTITLHKMPYIPMPALAYGGYLNDRKFLGIPKGKVKFGGCKVTRDYDAGGNVAQKAVFIFSYRPIADWNKVPDPKGTGTFVLLKYKTGASNYPYPYFNMLLVFPLEYYIDNPFTLET